MRKTARAIAFQGHVRDKKGNKISEVFIVDVPDRIDIAMPVAIVDRRVSGRYSMRTRHHRAGRR